MMNPIVEQLKTDLSHNFTDVPYYLKDGLDFRGDLDLLSRDIERVSIIGSRKPTESGSKAAESIARELVSKGVIIVSGLAEGIDTIAHKTTIATGGRTIAVLGTPIDKIYPKSNTDLFRVIEKEHLILSQFDLGTKTQPSHFPMRNRTMAFISDATIICDATAKSGTKHQAHAALRYGKKLFILGHIIDEQNVTWCKDLLTKGAKKLHNYTQEILSLQ